MKKDIILINPDTLSTTPNTNIGLASLESYLKNDGLSCLTINGWEINNYLDGSEVFGISVVDHTYVTAQKLTQRLRDKTVIWGGWTAKALPEFILKENPGVDYVVLGDGERRLVRLLESLQTPEKLREIDGIAYRDDRNLIVVRPPIEFMDMNELPLPTDLAVFNDLVYFELTRGCYGNCNFCQEVSKMRFKSARKAADEIEYWQGKGYSRFYIGNANSIGIGHLLREFLQELEERDLQVELMLVGRPNDVLRNHETLKMFFKSKTVQLSNIEVGCEANTQRTLDLLGRGTTPELNREAIEALISLKERYSPSTDILANIILFPHFDMTIDDFVENVRFIGDYQCSKFTMNSHLIGVANTQVWHEMKARGFEVQKTVGLRIWEYPFSNRDVERLFTKLIRIPFRKVQYDHNTAMWYPLHDKLLNFHKAHDIRNGVMDFLNS